MKSNSTIDVSSSGLVAAHSSDGNISVFQYMGNSPLGSYQLPPALGAVQRIAWAPSSTCMKGTLTTHCFVVDCDSGFALFDFVKATFVELRLRQAVSLPSAPESKWIELPDTLLALAITLIIPSVSFIRCLDETIAEFCLVRASPQALGPHGQHCVHWKEHEGDTKDKITLWPSEISTNFTVDAPTLVTCSRHSLLFAYTDAMAGGLYLGSTRNADLRHLPALSPVKLAWVKSGHIVCLTGPTVGCSSYRLVMYNTGLAEVFSFSEMSLGSFSDVDELILDDENKVYYRLSSFSDRGSPTALFDNGSTYSVSPCGMWLAMRAASVVSVWDVSQFVPRLVRVFDYAQVHDFTLLWTTFDTRPCLIAICDNTLLSVYTTAREPQIIDMSCQNLELILDVAMTKEGNLVICSSDSYHYVSADELWFTEDSRALETSLVHAPRDYSTPVRRMPLVKPDDIYDNDMGYMTARQMGLKRSYTSMAE